MRAAHATIDPSWLHEGTPIMVDGVLYTSTSLSQVAAIDAATGQTKWVFDPEAWKLGMPTNNGWLHRGVAYWRDGEDERVIMLTGHAYDDRARRPDRPADPDLRRQGLGGSGGGAAPAALPRWVYGNTSPPVVVRDVIVVGSSILDYPVSGGLPPGRRARVRRPDRSACVDLPLSARPRRGRPRDVGERLVRRRRERPTPGR